MTSEQTDRQIENSILYADCKECVLVCQALEKAAQANQSANAARGKVSLALNTVEQILVDLCK